MFPKFLAIPKHTPTFSSRKKPAATSTPAFKDDNTDSSLSSVLKIIHVGGRAEIYYMAVPAVSIMNKYPSFLLARPDIFRRPWDSLVHPEEILMPGERYFIVPQRTVRKLQRWIPQANGHFIYHVSSESSNSGSSSVTLPTSRHSRRSGKKKRKAVKWGPKLTIIHEGSPS